MKKEKNSFVVYYEWEDCCSNLTDEQVGKLARAIYALERRGEVYDGEDPIIRMAFSFIAHSIQANKEKYAQTVQRRAEAGRQGGAPKGNQNATKQPNACLNKQNNQKQAKQAKQADSDSERERDSDSDSEREREGDSEREGEVPAAAPSPHPQVEKAPSVQEVSQYATDHGLSIDAEKFCAFYGERGWKAGKNDLLRGGLWREKLGEWARTEFPRRKQGQKANGGPPSASLRDPRLEEDLRRQMEYMRKRTQYVQE